MIQISLYLVACLVLGLALLVWKARPESATNRFFGVFTFVIAAWVYGIASMQSGTNLVFSARLTFAASSLIPTAFLSFVSYYPTSSKWPGRVVLYVSWGVGLILCIISLTTRLVVSDVRMTVAGPARETGLFYVLFAAYFLTIWLTALVAFTLKWTQARELSRVQLHYLAVGVILSTIGGVTTNLILPLLTGNSVYGWIGPYFALILVAMVAHAIVRHRLMDVRLVIHRGLTFALALVVSLLPVAGLLALAEAFRSSRARRARGPHLGRRRGGPAHSPDTRRRGAGVGSLRLPDARELPAHSPGSEQGADACSRSQDAAPLPEPYCGDVDERRGRGGLSQGADTGVRCAIRPSDSREGSRGSWLRYATRGAR
jgi:hypothetical protein